MEEHFSCTETRLSPKLMRPVEFISCSIQPHVIDKVCNYSPQSKKTEEVIIFKPVSVRISGGNS